MKGLLPAVLVLLAAAPAVHWSHAQPMTVVMVDDRFQPDHLTFERGTQYLLRLENHGKDLHEFTAPEFFAAAVMRDPGQLANGGQEVVVQPGGSADIYLEPLKAGTYHLTCADHDWDGMVGEIVVR
ncbi:MAG TPA: cupredoxin domain-containing protein [Acetobacteraceae bacterium]|nr:cupredoxin domain-containing protein [Acetobacteraceae bacterium]